MSRGGGAVSYFALLLVILVGVAGGNLLADWITTQIDAYRADKKAPARPGRAGGQSQDGGGTKIPIIGDLFRSDQDQTREQRRRDRDGVRLAQTCEEWRQAHAQLKSETARDEMRRHCAIYERYVQDGVLPGKK